MSFKIMYIRLVIPVFLLLVPLQLFGQAPGCPMIDAGPDQSLPCGTLCTTLNATVLETGMTTTYSVSGIPYAPPYSFTGGTPLFIGIDDEWSGIIQLPFDFCFYNNTYNQIIVGTNGLISFDLTLAGGYCDWSFSSPIPTPGPPPGIYNNSINGPFHDIDPSVGGDINYALLGTPPCRTFVINYNQVPHFDCNNLSSTQQIVLYETTNAIEVYVQNKPVCNTWNSGNAALGIQDATGTNGLAAPGRNTGAWSASNEAWRFVPAGTPNYIITWYDQNNIVVGYGDSIQVCPAATTTYTAEVVYTNCNGNQVTVTDQVTVNIQANFTLTLTTNNASCPTSCDGSASVSVNGGGGPFTYQWTSGSTSNNTSNLCSGVISVTVTDSGGCSLVATDTVNANNGAVMTQPAFTDPTCNQCNGMITINATGGSAPYQYSIDGGLTYSGSAIFNNLCAGLYNLVVQDGSGCQDTMQWNLGLGTTPSITVNASNLNCYQDGSGSISITCIGGQMPYQYSIDGGATFQTFSQFNNLGAGSYNIITTDANGCQDTASIILSEPQPLAVTADPDLTICRGQNATFSATAGGGNGNYIYNWSNGSSAQTITVSPTGYPQTQSYTVSLTDGICPVVTDVVNVGYYPQPMVNFSGNSLSGCYPLTVTFYNNTSNSNLCQWHLGDGQTSFGCDSTFHTYNDPGIYDVSLNVTSDDGCKDSLFLKDYVEVYDHPEAIFQWQPDHPTILNRDIQFIDISSGSVNTWNWAFYNQDGQEILGQGFEQNPGFLFPEDTGYYPVQLQVTSTEGCSADTLLYVYIDGVFNFWVPNAFSPDGDGINDFFTPKGFGCDWSTYKLFIFNRWGEKIFESSSVDDQWDGTSGSKHHLVPNGVYVYSIQINDATSARQRHEYIGHISVVR